jgi:hypothetical protein
MLVQQKGLNFRTLLVKTMKKIIRRDKDIQRDGMSYVIYALFTLYNLK